MARATASRWPTGSAGPRTCRSRPSWRSPAPSRRWSSRSPCWRSPGARRATTPPPAAGPRRPGSPRSSTRRAWRVALRVVGFVVFLYAAMAAVLRRGPADQPVLRHLLRAGVGRRWSRSRCCSARSGRRSARSAPSTLGVREAVRQRPRPRRVRATPTRLGYWPAALGLFAFVWLELVYPYSTELGPVRLWCAAYVARDAASAAPCSATASTSAPTRSRSTRPWSPSCRSGAARDGPAGRAQPAGQPRHRPGPAGPGRAWSRCCSAARRSTRSRTPARWVQFVQDSTVVGVRCSTTWRCWRSASASG